MSPISTRLGAFAAAGLFAALSLGAPRPAAARDFVQDGAGMFSADTVAALNRQIGNFNAQTGKEIVVVTTSSLAGSTLQDAAAQAFSQQRVNGVLVYVARDDRRDIIVPDSAGARAGWFTPDVLGSIRTAMEAQFRSESYDAGITGAVGAILNVYRAHLSALPQSGTNGALAPAQTRAPSPGGMHISMFWWIIIIVGGFLLVRSLLRSMSSPRYYGGAPGAPPPGTPPGGPGYGPGYGGYGGGGSFWSGLLGGLGGAWLGNEMFRGGGGGVGQADTGQTAGSAGGWGGGGDPGGWQSDAGQAGTGASSGGDWSGGGFGGGDFGGGGGDMGGGDSGGGW